MIERIRHDDNTCRRKAKYNKEVKNSKEVEPQKKFVAKLTQKDPTANENLPNGGKDNNLQLHQGETSGHKIQVWLMK